MTALRARIPTSIATGALLLAALPFLADADEPWQWSNVARVVVVGDVHGAYSSLVEVLDAAGVVDGDLAWTGGDAHLVSLGDLLDRGPDSRRAMDLLMRLEDEALEDGGRVHVVLGNHELMNLIGDLRYVSAGEYAAFAAEETDAMRAAAYAEFAAAAGDAPAAATQAEFDRAYPRGYFAHRAAFAADGRYGAWLLSLPAIVVVNGTAYVHGGLPAVVAEAGLEPLNLNVQARLRRYLDVRAQLAAAGVLPAVDMQQDYELARAAQATAAPELSPLLAEFLELGEAPELGANGPMWYRGSIYCKALLEEPILDGALARLGATQVVVGHTPTDDRRVHGLYGGKLIMLDTGMLASYYRGRPAALVFEQGDSYVQYAAPAERAAAEMAGSVQGYGLTEVELQEALAQGAVGAVERGAGPWAVAVRAGDVALDALFYPNSDANAGSLELAAAALDELLGAALVPPTVPRTIDGEEGALQLRYADAISEAQRMERRLGFSGWCPLEPQLQLMYTFDLLTGNQGRTAGNVLYRSELSDLTVTDHRRAFGTARALPAGFDAGSLAIPAPLVAALRALDEAGLQAALGPAVGTRQIRALLERRDDLVESR